MINDESIDRISALALQVRRDAVRMIAHAGSGHVGGALGAAEILAVLYGTVLRYRTDEPLWSDRDRVLLSNGHICAAWYAVLSRVGFLSPGELATHRRMGSRLQGHPARVKLPALVESSSGPLGQGLSVANGLALALRLDRSPARVFCILGDGELAEGIVWEAIMSAGHYRLGSLVAIVLANGIQIDGSVEDIKSVEPLTERFSAFGWRVLEVDGHSVPDLVESLQETDDPRPTAIIARVTMARGVPNWEGLAKWHGNPISQAEHRNALEAIGTTSRYDDFPIEETEGVSR